MSKLSECALTTTCYKTQHKTQHVRRMNDYSDYRLQPTAQPRVPRLCQNQCEEVPPEWLWRNTWRCSPRMCQHLKCVQQTRQVKCLEAHQHGLPLVIQSWWFNPYFKFLCLGSCALDVTAHVSNCFHVAVVTTCYDLLRCNAYALCLMRCVNKAPTVWQTEETPAAAGQLSPQQSTVEHSGAQLHWNRIGIAIARESWGRDPAFAKTCMPATTWKKDICMYIYIYNYIYIIHLLHFNIFVSRSVSLLLFWKGLSTSAERSILNLEIFWVCEGTFRSGIWDYLSLSAVDFEQGEDGEAITRIRIGLLLA